MEVGAFDHRRLISCSQREIYREGGFYEDDSVLRALIDSSSANHSNLEVLAELYAPFSYRRSSTVEVHADRAFESELLQHYNHIDLRYERGPASILARLSDATVFGTVIYLNAGDARRIVYETYRPPDRPDSKLWSEAAAERYSSSPRSIQFFLGSVGSLNYGHWLVDDFPRLAAISILRSRFPDRKIEVVLPSYAHVVGEKWSDRWNAVRAQSIRCALRGESRVSCRFVELNRAYRFDNLFYATPVSYHPILKSKQALDFTASEHLGALRWFDRLHRSPRRLFVVRRRSRGRALQNLDAVAARLEKHGFTVIDPETLSVRRQAMVFAAAEIVVGVMGASMANSIFCNTGTRVIHLAPEGWVEPFYWDLAVVCGHRYSAYYGSVGDAVGPPHTLPFTLSAEAIDSLCASFG